MAIKRTNPFKLRNFTGADQLHVSKLENIGIKTTEQLLSAGDNVANRTKLALQAGIPMHGLIELVKLSDLARLPGVKGIRARLYFEIGVDCVEKMAACEPGALLSLAQTFVQQSGFPGIPPLPKEVSSTIANAQKLPKLVTW